MRGKMYLFMKYIIASNAIYYVKQTETRNHSSLRVLKYYEDFLQILSVLLLKKNVDIYTSIREPFPLTRPRTS